MDISSDNSRGFSLVELLVSVLIIAIGIIGLISLQSTSLRGNNGAYLRTQATFVAGDMTARMMANPDAVTAGAYDAVDSAAPPVDPGCITTGCNPLDLADQDIREWSQYFSNVLGVDNYRTVLPGASGSVTVTDDVFEVTVNWVEQTASGATPRTLTLQASL